MLPKELKKRVVKMLGLGTNIDPYVLLTKDNLRPQLRFGKKYRVERTLPFERMFLASLPDETAKKTAKNKLLNRKDLAQKVDLFFDRFTYQVHFDSDSISGRVSSSKWLDIVVMCKNKRNNSGKSFGNKAYQSHTVVYVAVVGMSSPVPLQESEQQRLHEDFLAIFFHRNRPLFYEFRNKTGPMFKIVIPHRQSSSGLFLQGYSTELGNYEEVFDQCLQHCLSVDEAPIDLRDNSFDENDEMQDFWRISNDSSQSEPSSTLTVERETSSVSQNPLEDKVEELKVRYFHAISRYSPIAIPIYASIPPYDDPLPLPMMICCCSFVPSDTAEIPEDGKISDTMKTKLIQVRSGLTYVKVRHPESEIQSSIMKSLYGATSFEASNDENMTITTYNVDVYDHQEIMTISGKNGAMRDSFVACFAATKDGRYLASITADHELFVRYKPLEYTERKTHGDNDDDNKDLVVLKYRLIDVRIAEDESIQESPMAFDVFPCCIAISYNTLEYHCLSIFIGYNDGSLRKYVINVKVPFPDMSSLLPVNIELGPRQYRTQVNSAVDINVIFAYDEYRLIVGSRNGQISMWDTTRNTYELIGCCDHHHAASDNDLLYGK